MSVNSILANGVAADNAEKARNEEWMKQLPKSALVSALERNLQKQGGILTDTISNPFKLQGKVLEAFEQLSYEEAVKKAEHAVGYFSSNPQAKHSVERVMDREIKENGFSEWDILFLKLLEHNAKHAQTEKLMNPVKNAEKSAVVEAAVKRKKQTLLVG